MSPRRLIVNADDFGMSEGVNAGVLRAHTDGIVTSASLMVRRPAAEHAVDLARRHRDFDLGLHVDLGEWRFAGGEWHAHDVVVDADDAEAVRAEIDRQVERFIELVGAPPSHLDSHQHVHRQEPVRSVAVEVADRIGVPLRQNDPRVRYCGDFYGQWGTGEAHPESISVDVLCRLIDGLPPGVTELGCHPGLDPALDSPYRVERLTEVETLCAARVREAVEDARVRLCSFVDLRTSAPGDRAR